MEVDEEHLLLEYGVEAPGEMAQALAHFAQVRTQCAGLIDVGFAMGGRLVRAEDCVALAAGPEDELLSAFDAFADAINRLNAQEEEEGVRLV